MRFILWICGLIFITNFLLLSHALDTPKSLVVNKYENNQDSDEWDSEEENTEIRKQRFSKLDNFSRQHFGRVIEGKDRYTLNTELPPLRHRKPGRKHKKKYFVKESTVGNQKQIINDNYEKEALSHDEPYLSPVSQQKLKDLGTEEAVKQQFEKVYGTIPPSRDNSNAEKNANEHYRKMLELTKCKIPTPKIIKVNDLYRDVFKQYYPSCTILYQCSEESGCCPETSKCSFSKSQNVTLYFKVSNLRSKWEKPINSYESLTFINHTECTCVRKPQVRQITYPPAVTEQSSEKNYVRPNPCSCPSSYSPRRMANGSCDCDCNSRETICNNFRTGMEVFSEKDSRCISEKRCSPPSCNYGKYLEGERRCPRMNEIHNFNVH